MDTWQLTLQKHNCLVDKHNLINIFFENMTGANEYSQYLLVSNTPFYPLLKASVSFHEERMAYVTQEVFLNSVILQFVHQFHWCSIAWGRYIIRLYVP